MVKTVGSLTGNGLGDWLIQRFTAVIVALYTVYLFGFLFFHPGLGFDQWSALFAHPWMRIASTITLLALLAHAWIGLWTIATDYLKITAFRLAFYGVVLILLFAALIWGIAILWGV